MRDFFWAATYLVAYWLMRTESMKEMRARWYMRLPVSSSVQPLLGDIWKHCCRLPCWGSVMEPFSPGVTCRPISRVALTTAKILALSKRAAKTMADDANSHMRYQRTLLRGCGPTQAVWTGHPVWFSRATITSSHLTPTCISAPQASRWYNAGCLNARVSFHQQLLSFRVRAEVFWDFASSPMTNPSVPSPSNHWAGHFSCLRSQTRYFCRSDHV
jgi:hypothetical protein